MRNILKNFPWSLLGAFLFLPSLVSCAFPNRLPASGEMKTMPPNAIIEWTKEGKAPEAIAAAISDITVFTDGRVRFGPRLGKGEIVWFQLSQAKFEELRRFVFDENRVMAIDSAAVESAVQAAASRRQKEMDSSTAVFSTARQMDAATTVLRAKEAGREQEVRLYDLFGNAQQYPEVEDLQRLRMIELRMLQIFEEFSAQAP